MARKLIVEIVGDSRSYERALGRSSKASKSFGHSVSQGSRHIARNIGIATAAIGALGVVAGKQFGSFEESLDRVVGLAGGAKGQVHDFGQEILQLAPGLGKGPQELADALYQVASAGIDVNKQMAVVTVSAQASASGLGETAVVADAVTSAMAAYGQANLTAASAADTLAATVREGKGEADAFAPVIGNVTALAAQLGVSFEEVGAALAAQTRLGIDSATASVQLQQVFSKLVTVAPIAEKAFKSVGLSSDDLRKQLGEKGLLSVLQTMREAFGGNIKAMAGAFRETRALRGVLGLVGKNADDVEGVFRRMGVTTGSLATALDAVSEGQRFKFDQLKASVQAAGIQLGGMFAPVAKKLASGLTTALGVFNDFLGDVSEAKTIRAKLEVIWEGVKDAAEGAQDILTRAVNAIDWHEVFAGAHGIAEELEKRIKEVDWSNVGTQIGAGFKEAADFLGPALQNLTEILSRALHDLDWEAVGVAAGPGLVTAMLSAFHALLDPGFWARNWQLALSVAIDALGLLFPETFAIKKLVGIMAKPFIRLISPLARVIGASIGRAFTGAASAAIDAAGRLSERLAVSLAHDLVMLPSVLRGIAGKIFGPFIRRVSAAFERLGEFTRFTLRLIGIAAVIRSIERFVHRVGEIMGGLRETVADAWNRVFNWIKKRALRAALDIIEPFTHIPGFLGGGAFQGLKEQWSQTLLNMEYETDSSVTDIHDRFDTLDGRVITVSVVTTAVPGEGGARRGEPGAPKVPRTKPPVVEPPIPGPDVETAAERARRLKAEEAKALKAAKKAADKATEAFQNFMDALSLKLDIATAKRGFADDLAVLKEIERAIQARIKAVGKTTELARELFENQQAQNEVLQNARKAAAFAALGLTPEGEKPTPGTGALLKKATGLQASIKGTILDTKKTRTQLQKIVAYLKSHMGKVGKEIRGIILQMLNEISGAADSGGATGPLTKATGINTKKILQGMGLSPDQVRELRGRLSDLSSASKMLGKSGGGKATLAARSAGFGGAQGAILIENHIYLDGKQLSTTVTKQQQKDRRRNPKQKRGPRRTGGV